MQPMPFCLLRSECSETGILASSTFSVHQKVSMLSKICIVSKIKIPANTNTNNIQFQKVTLIRILVFGLKYSNNIRIRNYSLTSVTIRIRHHHYHLYHCHHEIIGKLSNINIIFFVSNQSPYLPLISTHCIGMCTTLCSTL